MANFWMSKKNVASVFILDLGCKQTFDGIRIVNFHNSWVKSRATRRFREASLNSSFLYLTISRLFASLDKAGPWTTVLESPELEDCREMVDPLPLQFITLNTETTAQFLRFELVSWWGGSGGLQYFDIQRVRQP